MPAVDVIAQYFLWPLTAGRLAFYLRLRRQRLDRIYRVFAALVLFHVGRSIALAILPPVWYGFEHRPHVRFANNVYAWTWTLSEPILWILHVLVVLELCSLVFRRYKGIASMGRWAVLAGSFVAVGLSALTLPSELSHSAQHFPVLRLFGVIVRGLDTSLVIFLLLITAFLAWFPIPLNRNVVVYSLGYGFYFMAGALVKLAQNLGGDAAWAGAAIANMGIETVCLGMWIVLLNRAGETRTVAARHAWQPGYAEFLTGQLATINSTLLRSGRR